MTKCRCNEIKARTATTMAIEMQLHLLDETALNKLLNMDWDELINGLENGTLRDIRPNEDKRLHRAFDIDCEAEILDRMSDIQAQGVVKAILKKNKKAQEELRKIGRHELSTYNESVVNQIKIKRVYVINDNKIEKFGMRYELAKKMFKDVLEVTSKRMGEIIK